MTYLLQRLHVRGAFKENPLNPVITLITFLGCCAKSASKQGLPCGGVIKVA